MKVEVTRKCGHVQTVEVFGKNCERERKIAWLESTECEDCYNGKDCEEKEMLYKEYKENYADCKTKKDSYDKSTKTIIVFVPAQEVVDTTDEIVNEEHIVTVEAGETEYSAKLNLNGSKSQIDQAVNLIRNQLTTKIHLAYKYIDSGKMDKNLVEKGIAELIKSFESQNSAKWYVENLKEM